MCGKLEIICFLRIVSLIGVVIFFLPSQLIKFGILNKNGVRSRRGGGGGSMAVVRPMIEYAIYKHVAIWKYTIETVGVLDV